MAKHRIIHSPQSPSPIGPYSQAIQANGMIYVSGQIALDPLSGELRMGSISEETRQVLDNLKAVLEAGGASLNHVVKCSIFLSDMRHFNEVNAVYETYFADIQPARETVAVAGLPKAVHVEISAIACLTFTI